MYKGRLFDETYNKNESKMRELYNNFLIKKQGNTINVLINNDFSFNKSNDYTYTYIKDIETNDLRFDFILGDNIKTIDNMALFLRKYIELLNENGILIIEGINDMEWLKILENNVPEHLKKYVRFYDLREDMTNKINFLFSIDKLNTEKKKIKMVIARYKENIDWAKKYDNVIIYNKGEKMEAYNGHTVIELPNFGREGHTYYKYICDNYDNLDDYTIFLQGYPFDHSVNLISNLEQHLDNICMDFVYLSDYIVNSSLNEQKRNHCYLCCNIHTIFEHLFEKKVENHECIFGAGAQFIVSKNKILMNPKEFYEKIVKLLDNKNDPIEGHSIERFHKYVFY